ncbi:MAG: hypothetical protein P4M09_31125 [Devosia sp.]|nr:hypothetical protein [Devosia sp.]
MQEVQQPLLAEEINQLKHRLSIKMVEHETMRSRIARARTQLMAQRQQAREVRMARMRQEAIALRQVEQRMFFLQPTSQPAAYSAPPTDLTREGIEPNPSVLEDTPADAREMDHRPMLIASSSLSLCLFLLVARLVG